jgi:YidC/Oxa1 family membrane protein insertase
MSWRDLRSSSRVRMIALGLFLSLVAVALVACIEAPIVTPTPSVPAGASGSAGASGAAPSASAIGTGSVSPLPSASPSADPSAGESASPAPSASATPKPPEPLKAAEIHDPLSFLAWLFTPLFQLMLIIMAGVYVLTGNVAIAIIVLTILIRAISIPLFRSQIVSQRRMQNLAPELNELKKELNRRYKGDRTRIQQATMDFYKERGVNPAAGCLPTILTMFLIWPMYQVISIGLTSPDPTGMLSVFGARVVPLSCTAGATHPCINTVVAGIDVGAPNILFTFLIPIGGLALVAAFLQLIQSRMVMPASNAGNDSQAAMQRQIVFMMPLLTLVMSGFPAGIFIYWIVTTVFSIVQQYLMVGWGSMFPLFGWNPGFARDHAPRFPVPMPESASPGRSLAASRHKPEDRWVSAASTVRPKSHKRQGRRGRKR